MEFLVELLLELGGEFLLQIVFEGLAEAGLHFLRDHDRDPKTTHPLLVLTGYLLFGVVAGALSLLVFSHSFMHTSFARLANLVLTPIASGLAMVLLGAWRQRRGQPVIGIDRFFYGFAFAFAMAVVRFIWTS